MRKFIYFAFMATALVCFTFSCSEDVVSDIITDIVDVNLPPSNFQITISEITETTALATWSQSVDPENTSVAYTITLNDTIIEEGMAETTIELIDLNENTEYTLTVTAADEDGESREVTATFSSLEVNLAPGDFQISVDHISNDKATISWTASEDPNGDIVTYDVYLDGDVVASDLDVLTYSFQGLEATTTYAVKVVAKDDGGLTSESETTIETTSNPPSLFTISLDSISTSGVLIDWTDALDPDGDNVFYDMYVNGVEEVTGWTLSIFSLSALAPNTTYTIKIVARDSSGATTEETAVFNTLPTDNSFAVTEVEVSNGPTGPLVVVSVTDSGVVESITINDVTVTNFFTPIPEVVNFSISEAQYTSFINSPTRNGSITYNDGSGSVTLPFTYNIL